MNDENKSIKIAFLTSIDPQDKRSWSGIFYHTAQALQRHCGEVIYMVSTDTKKSAGKTALYKRLRNVLRKFSIARKYFVYNYRVSIARKFAAFAAQKLLEHPFDVVVAPASLTEVAFLDTDIPIVLVEDATFALLHNYYPQYSNLIFPLKRSSRKGKNSIAAVCFSWASTGKGKAARLLLKLSSAWRRWVLKQS